MCNIKGVRFITQENKASGVIANAKVYGVRFITHSNMNLNRFDLFKLVLPI
jgi:hypothetical protein